MKLSDPKTGELIDFVFLIRLTKVGINYLRTTLIPAYVKRPEFLWPRCAQRHKSSSPGPPSHHISNAWTSPL